MPCLQGNFLPGAGALKGRFAQIDCDLIRLRAAALAIAPDSGIGAPDGNPLSRTCQSLPSFRGSGVRRHCEYLLGCKGRHSSDSIPYVVRLYRCRRTCLKDYTDSEESGRRTVRSIACGLPPCWMVLKSQPTPPAIFPLGDTWATAVAPPKKTTRLPVPGRQSESA